MTHGNIIGTTQNWIKYNTFGEKEYNVFKEAISGVKEKDLKKKRGDLSKAIGESRANRLLAELFPPATVIEAAEETVVAKTEPTLDAKVTEKAAEHPMAAATDESQPISAEEEGVIGKITKWFKNLYN